MSQTWNYNRVRSKVKLTERNQNSGEDRLASVHKPLIDRWEQTKFDDAAGWISP
jgi:hypothetical protein